MSVTHVIDARDENIIGKNYWFNPDNNTCGITVFFNTLKIHLTSDQVETLIEEWNKKKTELYNKRAIHMLGIKNRKQGDS